MHRRILLSALGVVAAAVALMAASGGTGLAAKSTTLKSVSWGNILVAEGAHPVKIATLGKFHITAECTSGGEGKYFIKSPNTIIVEGEDSGTFTLPTGKPHYITDDVDYDEAFYAWAPSTGASVNGTTFNLTPSYTGTNNCEFQGVMYQTS
jgi:hypothetical protein